MKRAGQTSGRCNLHLKAEGHIAAREVVHAQDQGSTEAAFHGPDAMPDRPELVYRAEHRPEYLKAAEATGLKRPVVADWNDVRLTAALLPTTRRLVVAGANGLGGSRGAAA